MSSRRSGLSRRSFVSGVSSAVAAPWIISRRALGDDSAAPANDRIAIATIGNGKMMYGSHLPHFVKMPELQVVAVCDVDTTRREAAKKRVDEAYGNSDCLAYNDYREILARDDIDAVACATPDHWHAMVILDACKAGKDVYCEK
ncbi:MAG: Gfo/Idh/MocA family oxidoreductase, partial [Planctomycetales bacterium]|nr:Gfo/Idh/MocA family oxidoreductase [Planctomycetales bacterium]